MVVLQPKDRDSRKMDFCRYCLKHWLLIRCLLALIMSPVPVMAARLHDGQVPVVEVSAVEPVTPAEPLAESESAGLRIYQWRDRSGHRQFSDRPQHAASARAYQADYAPAEFTASVPASVLNAGAERKAKIKIKTGNNGRGTGPAAYISSSRLSARCIWLQGRMRSLGNLRELDPDSRMGQELERWRADWRNERCLKGGNFFNRKADIEARSIKVKAKAAK